MNITLSKVEESGEEVIVKSTRFDDKERAIALYNRLTGEYADQSLPFFDKGEQLIRLDILPDADESSHQEECYFEFTEELCSSLEERMEA